MKTNQKSYSKKNKNNRLHPDYAPIAFAVTAVSLVVLFVVSIIFIISNRNASTPANTEIAQTQSAEESTKSLRVDIDVLMIGDMLIHDGIYNSGLREDGTYNFDHLFENIKSDLDEADIKIFNQETILGGTELGLSNYPMFNSPQEIGEAALKAGFNVVCHATNHALDKRVIGVTNTLDFWDKHPQMAVLGIHRTQKDAENIYVYEKDGFSVAILNYTYGTNGIPIPSDMPYLVDTFDNVDKIRSDIRHAKRLADMVIVCPHWGEEYVFSSTKEQEYWNSIFLAEGVDLVLGTHPHVLEPVTTLTSESGHEMLVYYSLGNFVSCQDQLPRILGGMAKVTLTKEDGKTSITAHSIEPVITHCYDSYKKVTTYKLSQYTDTLASQNSILLCGTTCNDRICNCGAYKIGYSTHGNSNISVAYFEALSKAILKDEYK